MNIVAKKIEVYELQNASGSVSFGLFKVISQWEGMCKLESLSDNDTLIVSPDLLGGTYECTFKELFTFIKGESLSNNFRVLAASPDLSAKILAAKGE